MKIRCVLDAQCVDIVLRPATTTLGDLRRGHFSRHER